jgi:hypothetical protein
LPGTLHFELADAVLGVGLHLAGAERVAAAFASFALVAAEKNMVFEVAHRDSPLGRQL